MAITTLAGGVGSARLLSGLIRVVDPADVTVVVNVGDDEEIRGLHVSPDIDTVLYHLADESEWERGWGVSGDSFRAHERYVQLASGLREEGVDLQDWFQLGDLDLAANLLRTRLLATGWSLSRATDALRRALGIRCRVLPVTDQPVRTRFRTPDGSVLSFQEYFVRLRQEPEVAAVEIAGAQDAAPAPAVLEAIGSADLLLIPPSNPLLSVEPLLAVSGIREAISARRGGRVAMSPIVGGRALKGPADRLLRALGHEVSPVGVARIYRGLIDVFVLDERDASFSNSIAELGMRPVVLDTIMRSAEDAARLAKAVVERA